MQRGITENLLLPFSSMIGVKWKIRAWPKYRSYIQTFKRFEDSRVASLINQLLEICRLEPKSLSRNAGVSLVNTSTDSNLDVDPTRPCFTSAVHSWLLGLLLHSSLSISDSLPYCLSTINHPTETYLKILHLTLWCIWHGILPISRDILLFCWRVLYWERWWNILV